MTIGRIEGGDLGALPDKHRNGRLAILLEGAGAAYSDVSANLPLGLR